MSTEQLEQDLRYVASAVHRSRQSAGVPVIYYLWAAIVVVGYALPDFAPRVAAWYWIVFGIGGGLASWWIATRDVRLHGARDVALGRRWGFHWLIGGLGFAVCWLPALHGAPASVVVGNFMLVAGLVYALAGIHLERPLLWPGLVMLLGYVVLSVLRMPGTWTITGVIVALGLIWGGVSTQRQRAAKPQ